MTDRKAKKITGYFDFIPIPTQIAKLAKTHSLDRKKTLSVLMPIIERGHGWLVDKAFASLDPESALKLFDVPSDKLEPFASRLDFALFLANPYSEPPPI